MTIYSLDVLLSQFGISPLFVPCPVLTVAPWPAYRFLRRQVRWSGISISLKNFPVCRDHTVKGFTVVNEAEVNVFLEFSCFFYDSMDVSNLSSGSSAFSKSSLYIWKFLVHVLLKTILKDFEYYLPSVWNDSNCMEVWPFLGITWLLWVWNEN